MSVSSMPTARIRFPQAGEMNLDLNGQSVTEVTESFVVQLSFSSGSGIQIENAISLTTSAGTDHISLAKERANQLALLVDRVVANAAAEDSGALDLLFTGGEHLRVEPDSDFEAWTFFSSDGLKVVALPGGGLSVWAAPRASDGSPDGGDQGVDVVVQDQETTFGP